LTEILVEKEALDGSRGRSIGMDQEPQKKLTAVPLPQRPFFSVVMPVYNGETYISDAIESVVAQTDLDWELVIINDCSNDQTPRILADYASRENRIQVLSNGQNLRVARSLNRGIQAARGKWIVRLDADDVFTPGYLEALRSYNEKAGPDYFFSSWITVMDESSNKILDVRLPKAETIRRMMKIENFLYHPATSFSKCLWEKVGGYPEHDPAIAEDTAMWNRFFLAQAKLVMIPDFLVRYRLHYTNMTSVKDAKLLLNSVTTSRDCRMIRQNREWRASLFLKQRMLKLARLEILKIGQMQKYLSLKNSQYFLLTFLPESFVSFFMWEIRPRWRALFKKVSDPILFVRRLMP